MHAETPKRDVDHKIAGSFADGEYGVIKRTMRRYDVVQTFLAAGPRLVLGCFWREPHAIAAVLRVFWQRRQMARALHRRGLPDWLASRQ